MRILICSMSGALGGMERRIQSETKLLSSQGHAVMVATPWFPGSEAWQGAIADAGGEWINWRPYKFIEREHFWGLFRWLALSTLPTLRRYRIDLAHIAVPYNFVGMTLAYVLNMAAVPFVMSIHGNFSGRGMRREGKHIARGALAGLAGGYAVSGPAHDNFLKLYDDLLSPGASFDVILNGIDLRRFAPDAVMRQVQRRELGIGDADFVALLCGRLDAMKRPLLAIHGFAAWAATGQLGYLLIVGDGPAADSIKLEIARLGLKDRVLLVGQVSDTAPYYAASDCYLSTSNNQEACPLAAAEALASGLPAIVPDDDIFGPLYGDCSAVRLCDPVNVDAWVESLRGIAASGIQDRMIEAAAAREFAAKRFSLESMNQNLVAFYAQLQARLHLK